MAAQGHLWDPVAGRPARYVRERGWDRLFPPFARAGEVLGQLRPDLAARTGAEAAHPEAQNVASGHNQPRREGAETFQAG